MPFSNRRMKIFSGNANPQLAQDIASHIGNTLGQLEAGRFKNGEIRIQVHESVRGADCFVVQPTSHPVNENLMELLIIVDALRRASARRINVVVPFYGYARQDRKSQGREPISAKLVANLITTAGADRMLTIDLHAGQIQGFFDIPVDNLSSVNILSEYYADKGLDNPVVVSPDVGGVARARIMANILGLPLAFIDKRRPEPGVSEVMNVVGNIQDRTCILVDDMIDSGGTTANAAEALRERGAREVYACCTHPVFSGNAMDRLASSPIKEVVVTNTIPLPPGKRPDKIEVLSVAPLLGEAIVRINEHLSVSKLFKQ